MKIVLPTVQLMQISNNPSKLLEEAGRTCYKSEDKITDDSASRFVQMIDKRGHHSVIEHAYATFRIVTDRGITHEIVRHRLASYSQESTRYCNYGKSKFGNEISVVEPFGLSDEAYSQWRDAVEAAERYYFQLIEYGCKPQIARSVLPTCLKTEIVMTANFREWLHFLKLRTAEAAHPDMRIVAREIGSALAKECPDVFGQYETG
jgi:thymidylate synthase (FAD)